MKIKEINYPENNTISFLLDIDFLDSHILYVKHLKSTPRNLDSKIIQEGITVKTENLIVSCSKTKKRVLIELKCFDDNLPNESSLIFVFKEKRKELNYFEIIRQGSNFLKKNYNFNLDHGYCIYGRNNISSKEEIVVNKEIKCFSNSTIKDLIRNPNLKNDFPLSSDNQLKTISRVLQTLISYDLTTGPCKPSSEYDHASFTNKISMLKDSVYSVQCSGFRDLFVSVTASMGIRVRNIDANNYNTNVKNLVSWGHSFCEIFLTKLNKWVIFDPWYCGLMIFNEDQSPLSVTEVLNRVTNSSYGNLQMLSMFDSWNRRVIGSSNRYNFFPHKTGNLHLMNCSSDPGGLHLSPGYLQYFKHIRITNINIKDLPN